MRKMLFALLIMAGSANAALHNVSIANFAFSPAQLTVQQGDTVRWTNQDSYPHTATSDSGVWDSGNLNNGDSYSFIFTSGGSYPYSCLYHSSMTGLIDVESAGQAEWRELDTPTNLPLKDVFFVDDMTGWAGGDQGIIRTIDGGESWNLYNTTDDVEALHFINNMEGWACGNDGMILHSTNGGVSWTPQPSGVGEKLRDIRMADNMNGWTVGRDGILRRTTNGGVSWSHQPTHAFDDLRGIFVYDASTAWVVGSDGVILHTTDAGANWDPQPSGTAQELEGVHFIDNLTGWACGDVGIIVKTTNGGFSWQTQNSGTNTILNDIFFVHAMTGWAVGEGGTVLSSTDGGVSWETTDSGIFSILHGAHFLHADLGYAAGSNGSVFKYSIQTGIDDLESSLPGQFALKSNYPNPFNASTSIEFEVNSESNVRLETYDITGRLVAVLYDGTAAPGTHLVTWDASRQSSGVYFYRLRTASGTETRRMTLLK